MFRVFVSYAQKYLPWATHLSRELNGPGIQVYVAENDAPVGKSLSDEISRAIGDADLFVLLWSEEASESDYVGKEVFFARGQDKSILPVVLEPGVPLPDQLGDIKYLDIAKDPQGQVAWLLDHIEERAKNKRTSNFVGFGLLAFMAWGMLGGQS